MLRFLNDYRKTLALLKIKSFYANHLCKKNCLQGRLNQNNESCLSDCDGWLDRFFKLKSEKNPDPEEVVLFSSAEVPEKDRVEYQRGVAKLRLSLKDYTAELGQFVDDKIAH